MHFLRVLKDCPNTVQALFKLEDVEAYALELCSHQTLRHLVKPWKPNEAEAKQEGKTDGRGRALLVPDLGMLLELCTDVARGLSGMHSRGVVHRDLKPLNILLTRDRRTGRLMAVITDFGLSYDTKSSVGIANELVGGTPGYYIPSDRLAAHGKHNTVRPCHDMWSLGCTLFEAAVGKNVYTQLEDGEEQRFSKAHTETQNLMKGVADGKWLEGGISSPLSEGYLSMKSDITGKAISRDTILCDFEPALHFLNEPSLGSSASGGRPPQKSETAIRNFSRRFFDLVSNCFEREESKRPTSASVYSGLERMLSDYRKLGRKEGNVVARASKPIPVLAAAPRGGMA